MGKSLSETCHIPAIGIEMKMETSSQRKPPVRPRLSVAAGLGPCWCWRGCFLGVRRFEHMQERLAIHPACSRTACAKTQRRLAAAPGALSTGPQRYEYRLDRAEQSALVQCLLTLSNGQTAHVRPRASPRSKLLSPDRRPVAPVWSTRSTVRIFSHRETSQPGRLNKQSTLLPRRPANQESHIQAGAKSALRLS